MSRTFGIEVEFTGDRNAALAALQQAGLARVGAEVAYNARDAEKWVMKTDSSVRDGGEMVSPVLDFGKPEHRMQVNAAVKALRQTGAKTSHTAGIHVHVGLDGLSEAERGCLAKFAVKYEDFLYRIGASGWKTIRANWQQYCKPYSPSGKAYMVQHDFAWGAVADYAVDHTYFLNPAASHGTLEIRSFNSSLNATRIQGYIALSVAIVQAVRFGRVQRSLNRFNCFPLGGMKEGWRDEDQLFNSVMRTIACRGYGLHPVDRKVLTRLWADSKPQDSAEHRFAIPGWIGDEAVKGKSKDATKAKRLTLADIVGDEEFVSEEADDRPPTQVTLNYPGRDDAGVCNQCERTACTCCRYCGDTYSNCRANRHRTGNHGPHESIGSQNFQGPAPYRTLRTDVEEAMA